MACSSKPEHQGTIIAPGTVGGCAVLNDRCLSWYRRTTAASPLGAAELAVAMAAAASAYV